MIKHPRILARSELSAYFTFKLSTLHFSLTEEQILQLAPDIDSAKGGKEYALPSKWTAFHINGHAAWGECMGSGDKPYKTGVDLSGIVFTCSCPSKKFPCKHGIGLLLMHTLLPDKFIPAEEPEWLQTWFHKHAGKEDKKPSKSSKPGKPSPEEKRLQERDNNVADGIGMLKIWIRDIIRGGLASIAGKDKAWFQQMSERMVDAQAPGLATRIMDLAQYKLTTPEWEAGFMDMLLELHCIIDGYSDPAIMGTALIHDLRAAIGFTVKQEDLRVQDGITDDWLVMATQESERDKIITKKTWLYGIGIGKYALILQYIAPKQTDHIMFVPRMVIHAELVFYPSALPLRAMIKSHGPSGKPPVHKGYSNWEEVLAAAKLASATVPFLHERPYVVCRLTPVQHNNQWWLKDSNGNILQIKSAGAQDRRLLELLSVSGGLPLDTAIVGKEDRYEAIGYWYNNSYRSL